MHLLILSRNPVVRELIAIALKELGATFDYAVDPTQITRDQYDMVFVDDQLGPLNETIAWIQNLIIGQSILLYREPSDMQKHFGAVLKKPFLPSEIVALCSAYREHPAEVAENFDEISLESFVRSGEKDEVFSENVLDLGEIQEIRDLLEGKEVDDTTSHEEEARENDTEDSSKVLRMDGDALIEMLSSMKSKRLHNLLEDAEVTLTIRFPRKEK